MDEKLTCNVAKGSGQFQMSKCQIVTPPSNAGMDPDGVDGLNFHRNSITGSEDASLSLSLAEEEGSQLSSASYLHSGIDVSGRAWDSFGVEYRQLRVCSIPDMHL